MVKAITVFITRGCSLRCPHCMIWKTRKGERPPEYWALQFKHAWKLLGENVHIVILGGEPLEYPGFEKLIMLLGRANYSVTSNSLLLTETLAKRLASYGLPNWTVSIDLPEELGDPRDKAGFRAIRIMKSVGIPDIHVTVTVYPWNVKHLRRLFRQLKELDVHIEVTFASWANSKDYDSFPYMGIKYTPEMVEEIRRAVLEDLSGYPMWHGVDSMFTEDIESMLENRYSCSGPFVLTVDEDGHMRLCRDIPGKRVRKYELDQSILFWSDFARDWYADKAELCNGCNWDCIYMAEKGFDGFTHLNEFRLASSK
jgi:MoaA/NifB/PqqE/SkfB family radical SAM enzyme